MYSIKLYLAPVLLSFLFFTNCTETENQQTAQQQESRETVTAPAAVNDLTIDDPRARPASQGTMSAAYFTISNPSSEPDTLLSITSDVAELIEIHESFEEADGMKGMRKVDYLEIASGETVRLEPGGYHLMLIRLTQTLGSGDEFEMTLHFAQKGDETVHVTVQQI